MAQIALGGRMLRLRLYPKPKSPPPKKRRDLRTLALFDMPADDSLQDTPAERLAAKVAALCLLNRVNAEIVQRAPELGIRDWWLTSGCLFQTVWNLRSGYAAERGIKDYDLFYFSEDTSWEAEDEVIRAAAKLFAGLGAVVQVRNQARVHLWYPEKFGVAYPPLTTAGEGLLRFPNISSAIGMKRTGEDFFDVYAPYGLGDTWDMVARPNRALPLAKVFSEKTERWQTQWPRLVVYPWVEEDAKNTPNP